MPALLTRAVAAGRRTATVLGAGLLLLAAAATTAPATAAAPVGPAPAGQARYVVVLEDGVQPEQTGRELARKHGGRLGLVYAHALSGFSMTLSSSQAALLARDHRVASIERDQVVRATSTEVPTGAARAFLPDQPAVGLGTGAQVDVDIAVIDSGLDSGHPDLDVVGGTDCTSGRCVDGTFEDANGHGTHVAGSAAARDNGAGVVGMAPGARLHAVKVLDAAGSGYTSWTIAGLDWVTARAETIEVANMSLGCRCTSTAQSAAITRAVSAGVTVVVAAGNSDADTRYFSPANHPDVITVSALADSDGAPGGTWPGTMCRRDQEDTLADFSNWGSLVEITAPGTCITSTWPGGRYAVLSGTSMAAPHVAGAAALLASTRSTVSRTDTVTIRNLLVSNGNTNWTDDSRDGRKERLLDVRNARFAPRLVSPATDDQPVPPVQESPTPAPSNTVPTAGFTSSCTDLACTFTSSSTDSDGTLTGQSWTFGDGGTGSGSTAGHSYAAGGTYAVTLTVTDDDGAQASTTRDITVAPAPTAAPITVTAQPYSYVSRPRVDLRWSGASTRYVDVRRNGVKVTRTYNDGRYADSPGARGTYTYTVCLSGSTTCSAPVSVTA